MGGWVRRQVRGYVRRRGGLSARMVLVLAILLLVAAGAVAEIWQRWTG